jgi:hypothetical protein
MFLIEHRKFPPRDRAWVWLFMKKENSKFAHNQMSKAKLQFHSCYITSYSTELSSLIDMDHEEYTSRLKLAII